MIPWEVTQRSKVKQQVRDRPSLRAPDVEKQRGYPSGVQKLSQNTPEDCAVCVSTSLPCLSLSLQRPNWIRHTLWLIVPQFHSFMWHPARILFHWVLVLKSLWIIFSLIYCHIPEALQRGACECEESRRKIISCTQVTERFIYTSLSLRPSLSFGLALSDTSPRSPLLINQSWKHIVFLSLLSFFGSLSLPELQHSSLHPWFNPVPLDCCS